MGCFGTSVKGQSTQQVDKFTPDQMRLVSELVRVAGPAIGNVQGATIPGQEFAPGGPGPLQQQAFGLASQLPGQMAFDPSQINQAMQPVGDFAQNMFQQETIPGIMGGLGYQGAARSSGAADILGREGRNLSMGLAGQFAPMQYGAQQASLGRQQQLPGQLAGMGAIQQGFPEAQRQYGLQQFMAGAPEQDPRLGFIGPAFTSAYDTAVQQGVASQGLGSQLIGTGASLGMAKIMFGCIAEGTIIDCGDCKKPVEDVRAGDVVYNKDNSLSVVLWKCEFPATGDNFIELVFANGTRIIVSPQHKLGGTCAKDIRVGEKDLISKTYVPLGSRSYDLLTSGRDGSYRSNGIAIDSMIPELYQIALARKVA